MNAILSETLFFFVYRWLAWPVLRVGFEILGRFVPKIEKGLELRRAVNGRAPWIKALPPAPQTVWFHCASGEFEYAKPVIALLKQRSPQTKVVVTFFSPTYVDTIRKFSGVDWVVPLPWDVPRDLNAFLGSYRPMALLVARTDVWPEMARQARLRGFKSALFSASLSPRSRRMRGLARWATRATLNQLNAIFCVSAEDLENFRALNLGRPTLQTLGDTRYDQVVARLSAPKPLREEIFLALNDRALLVCGSTWPEDESVLVPALAALRSHGVAGCLVPHEPTESHLAQLEDLLVRQGFTPVRYSDSAAPEKLRAPHVCLIVDQTGLLAELYVKGRWAFVGGSFRKNVHSVMEPLAAGCLTFVGPFHQNNREALAFQKIKIASSKDLSYVTAVSSAIDLSAQIQQAQRLDDVRSKIKGEVLSRTGSSAVIADWILSPS